MIRFFASAPKGLEYLLQKELIEFGASEVKESRSGVYFQGDWKLAYEVCLWSRIASRIVYPILEFDCSSEDALYAAVRNQVDWTQHLDDSRSFVVESHLKGDVLRHSVYASQKIKDAIVDQFSEEKQPRPSVDRNQPDLILDFYLNQDRGILSVNLSGKPLHQRGYRLESGVAPLRENLAAGMLMRGNWLENYQKGGELVDPMCGSGTLLIEAAMMALDWAPNLERKRFGFMGWSDYDHRLWQDVHQEALSRRTKGLKDGKKRFFGFDSDARVLEKAKSNIQRAGLADWIDLEVRRLDEWKKWGRPLGLVATNPPYGERLGEKVQLCSLYGQLGSRLKEVFPKWNSIILTSDALLGKQMGIRAAKTFKVFNGSLPCELLYFENHHDSGVRESEPEQAFRNRLAKNQKNRKKWSKREKVEAYRVYDADLPDYNAAIDLYRESLVIQEYEAPKSISEEKAQRRVYDILRIAPDVLGIEPRRVYLKQRLRQRGTSQYEKAEAPKSVAFTVIENELKFRVNLTDYLDTGLFLDHRLTRQMLRERSKGKRFLNLFAYTGTATVYAAAGGATRTSTVDLSHTYLDWAKENLKLNGFRPGPDHEFYRDDCVEFLKFHKEKYDLIFLDPPTFSNSKRMDSSFDVQRDHLQLIQGCARLLAPGGEIIFSNNFRKFKLDHEGIVKLGFRIEDLSERTLPEDFKRNAKIHGCWSLRQG